MSRVRVSAKRRIAEHPASNTNHHLRELESWPLSDQRPTITFRQFVEAEIIPELRLHGYKMEQKKSVALQIVHNLVLTGPARAIADSRDTADKGVRVRVQVWNAIEKAGLAEKCLGSESSGKLTRYRITAKLLKPFADWPLSDLQDLTLTRNTENEMPSDYGFVVWRDKDNQPLPLCDLPPPLLASMRQAENEIERINRSNTSHAWQAFLADPFTGRKHTIQPNVCLRQIHSKEAWRHCRLYSWGPRSAQQLSKEERQTIRIDGQPACELDFSGYATRMLYHLFAREDPGPGDVYRPQLVFPRFYAEERPDDERKAIRDLVKGTTNRCLNVKSKAAAIKSVGNLLHDGKNRYREFQRKAIQYEGTNHAGIVERIIKAHDHPKLRRWFFSQVPSLEGTIWTTGDVLFLFDGMIMLRILGMFADAGKPALGIHDSVVCKASDSLFCRATMRDAYRSLVDFRPKIKREF